MVEGSGPGQGTGASDSERDAEALRAGWSLLLSKLAVARATVWLCLRRSERALGVLERALARGGHGTLYRHRAGLLTLLDRREEAAQALGAALRFDSLDGATRIQVAETLLQWGWDKGRVQAFFDEYDLARPLDEDELGPVA